MMAAMLSGGLATHQLSLDPLLETGISQFFLAIDPANLASAAELTHIADGILADLHSVVPLDPAKPVRYPGEQTLQIREENLRLGVPVDPDLWHQINLDNTNVPDGTAFDKPEETTDLYPVQSK
jgi:3-dehydro-L-gulonate 2-dehydrogenase